MRLAVAGALLLLTPAGCAGDLPPLLNPSLSAAQIAALPGKAGVRDAHYVATYGGPDGTVYQTVSGTVQMQPVHGLSQTSSVVPGKGGVQLGETREVGGVVYNQVFPGWSHPRWMSNPAYSGAVWANPIYFDGWGASGGFRVEGQEGSAVDRAWRLVSQAGGTLKPGATIRLWIRQRDGYPLKYRLDFTQATTTIVFDRINSGARVSPPPARDLLPPTGVADVARYAFDGGAIRVLTADYSYRGPLVTPSDTSERLVGVEVYVDAPPTPSLLADPSRWQLISADGTRYPGVTAGAGAWGKGNGGTDLLAFFRVPADAQRPFTLHVVLTDFQKLATPNVVVDALIKLS